MIDDDNAAERREPPSSFRAPTAGRLIAAIALLTAHSVGRIEQLAGDRGGSRSVVIQRSGADPVDAAVAAYPEILRGVLQYLDRHVVKESFFRRDCFRPVVLEPDYAVPYSADPEAVRSVAQQRDYLGGCGIALQCRSYELAILVLTQAGVGPKQQCAVLGFGDHANRVAAEAVRLRIGPELSSLEANDAGLFRADPEVAVAAFEERVYEIVRNTLLAGIAFEFSVLQAAQARACSYPERAIPGFYHGSDYIVGQPVSGCIRGEPPIFQFGQTAVASDPKAAVSRLINRPGLVVGQTFKSGVARDLSVFDQVQSASLGSHPQVSFAVFGYRIDVVVGKSPLLIEDGKTPIRASSQAVLGSDPDVTVFVLA